MKITNTSFAPKIGRNIQDKAEMLESDVKQKWKAGKGVKISSATDLEIRSIYWLVSICTCLLSELYQNTQCGTRVKSTQPKTKTFSLSLQPLELWQAKGCYWLKMKAKKTELICQWKKTGQSKQVCKSNRNRYFLEINDINKQKILLCESDGVCKLLVTVQMELREQTNCGGKLLQWICDHKCRPGQTKMGQNNYPCIPHNPSS